jgi:hypothetical protein
MQVLLGVTRYDDKSYFETLDFIEKRRPSPLCVEKIEAPLFWGIKKFLFTVCFLAKLFFSEKNSHKENWK